MRMIRQHVRSALYLNLLSTAGEGTSDIQLILAILEVWCFAASSLLIAGVCKRANCDVTNPKPLVFPTILILLPALIPQKIHTPSIFLHQLAASGDSIQMEVQPFHLLRTASKKNGTMIASCMNHRELVLLKWDAAPKVIPPVGNALQLQRRCFPQGPGLHLPPPRLLHDNDRPSVPSCSATSITGFGSRGFHACHSYVLHHACTAAHAPIGQRMLFQDRQVPLSVLVTHSSQKHNMLLTFVPETPHMIDLTEAPHLGATPREGAA